MNVEVELNGTRYINIGGDWYDARTLIKPPHEIARQLDRHLPVQRSVQEAKKFPKPVEDKDRTFTHDELFPVIADIIVQTSQASQSFVTHEEIVSCLLKHPEGRELVMIARERQGKGKTPMAVASNMVAWFSQRLTVHNSDYQDMFERQRIEGNWAYRPVQDCSDRS